jgi:CheY-like chemotaxis protein
LSVLAHELRNPLAALRSASDFLSLEPSSDPNVQRAGRVIRDQVTQLVRVTDEWLDGRGARDPEPDSRGQPRRRSKLGILVVDDNKDAVEMLTLLLETMGHAVHAAFDGRQAITAAAEHSPDLILLDIGLPELDGYEACRRIRAQGADRPPIIVAVTGWGLDQDKQRARDAGFDRHVTKPIDVAALRSLIDSLGR